MKISEVNINEIRCEECGGKPDNIYFNGETNEIICSICNSCKEIFEYMIKKIGKSFE